VLLIVVISPVVFVVSLSVDVEGSRYFLHPTLPDCVVVPILLQCLQFSIQAVDFGLLNKAQIPLSFGESPAARKLRMQTMKWVCHGKLRLSKSFTLMEFSP